MGTVRELTISPGLTHRPLLGISAHEYGTDELARLCRAHKRQLERLRFVATASTATLLGHQIDAQVEPLFAARDGGDVQLASRVLDGGVAGVVVLRGVSGHSDAATEALVEVCEAHDVLLATNAASAAMLVLHLARAIDGAVRISHPSVFSDGRFPWDPDRLHRPRGGDTRRRVR